MQLSGIKNLTKSISKQYQNVVVLIFKHCLCHKSFLNHTPPIYFKINKTQLRALPEVFLKVEMVDTSTEHIYKQKRACIYYHVY